MRNKLVASLAVVFVLAVGGTVLAFALTNNTLAVAHDGETASVATPSCCPDGACCPLGDCCPVEPCCSGRASPTKIAEERASCCPEGDCCPDGACCAETGGAVKGAVK
jgi:hypothetical protein